MSRQEAIQKADGISASDAQKAAFDAEIEAYNKSTSRVSLQIV